MTRYVIDAPTLLHLIDNELRIDPSIEFVAPSSIRSEALQLLLPDVSEGRRTDKAALETHERIRAHRASAAAPSRPMCCLSAVPAGQHAYVVAGLECADEAVDDPVEGVVLGRAVRTSLVRRRKCGRCGQTARGYASRDGLRDAGWWRLVGDVHGDEAVPFAQGLAGEGQADDDGAAWR
jgi:hypothetical protein